MSEPEMNAKQMESLIAAAIADQRPVLVNPTADELRQKAEELRLQGRLICTFCRKPIEAAPFQTRRISFGPRLEAVAHLHPACELEFEAAMQARSLQQGV